MKKLYWLLALPLIAFVWFALQRGNPVVEIHFVHPARETLVSTLPTNGKVEPIEWSAVRVESPGLVVRLPVRQGQTVSQGTLLAQLSEPGVADQVAAARARTAQARTSLEAVTAGGTPAETTDIENQIARAQAERSLANTDYLSLQRLNQKQAATAMEMEGAHNRVRQFDLQLEALARQRSSLVAKADIAASRERLTEAQATERATASKLTQALLRAPLAGVIYELPARQGSFLNAGDLLASIGQLDRLRIRVYVDEPELGRVAVGQPVKITWDALPDRSWQGTVERLPTQIAALNTRQVGEVICTISNPGRQLVPGTNVNASIETNLVPNALTIPKEAVRRGFGMSDLFVLEGDRVRRRKVQTGASSITRTQIQAGLTAEDSVALPGDRQLKDGDKVKPNYQ